MSKLNRIYLVRHGESVANVDIRLYHKYPDHAVPLSDLGKKQAESSGIFLKQHFMDRAIDLGEAPKIRLWQSPYLRTRQTAEHLMKNCSVGDILHDYREDTMLVEQQFGFFDGLTEEEQKQNYPLEYANYQHNLKHSGKYWACFPGGESPFTVDIRTRHMQGTFARDAEKHDIDNIIVISHGITTRIMTMRYLHESYEYYDQEKNPKNGSVRLLERDEHDKWVDRGYIFIP